MHRTAHPMGESLEIKLQTHFDEPNKARGDELYILPLVYFQKNPTAIKHSSLAGCTAGIILEKDPEGTGRYRRLGVFTTLADLQLSRSNHFALSYGVGKMRIDYYNYYASSEQIVEII